MKVEEFKNFPVKYKDFIVYPEYYCSSEESLCLGVQRYLFSDQYAVVGLGNSSGYTKVVVASKERLIGERKKISIFTGENSKVSPVLNAIDIPNPDKTRLGIVICKEVLHTCIAEVYRMMGVNLLATTIGGGQFWDLQRESWIDQMVLFSTIVGCPMVVSCGASKSEGGLNLIVTM